MIVHAILEDLYQKIFEEIASRADIFAKSANWEEQADEKLQRIFKDQSTRDRTVEEGSITFIAFARECVPFKSDIQLQNNQS